MNERSFSLAGIDHVQIAAPRGCETEARRFFGHLLGLEEIEKPEELRSRGGCWFKLGTGQLHIGVEEEFQPALKAHPAFAVNGLDGLFATLTAAGVRCTMDHALPGTRRFYAHDPWGNRLEFAEVAPVNSSLVEIEQHLQQLEESLFQPEVRRDPAAVSALLADDFLEFGSSGRRFTRQQIIEAMQVESPLRVSATDFRSCHLSEDAVLLTYRSVGEQGLQSLRSSLWVRRTGRWQMLFHQGTRVAPEK
jgi:catechol 2,3-dioxygenase-like lactoylglutathione lyase family enzyme